MSDGQIRIVESYVQGLHAAVAQAAVDLGTNTLIPKVDFSAASRIEAAWDDLYSRWDEHRTNLANTLWDVEEALKQTVQQFNDADTTLASGLDSST